MRLYNINAKTEKDDDMIYKCFHFKAHLTTNINSLIKAIVASLNSTA